MLAKASIAILILLNAILLSCGSGLYLLGGTQEDEPIPVPPVDSPGGGDSSFGGSGSGSASFDLDGGEQDARAVAILSNGKILISGTHSLGSVKRFALLRLNADGTRDTTFGEDGWITHPITINQAEARGMALDNAGRIYLCGETVNGSSFAVLMRLTPDGALDSTFGSFGLVLVAYSGLQDAAYACAWQSDYVILVGKGSSQTYMYHIDNFGSVLGHAGHELSTFQESAKAVAITSAGKIFMAGNDAFPSGIISAFDANLSQHSDFAGAGFVNPAGQASLDAIALEAEGVTAAGALYNHASDYSFFVTKYDFAGLLKGALNVPFGSTDSVAHGLAIQSDGKYVLAGEARVDDDNSSFAIARVTTGFTLDTSFNSTGRRLFEISPGNNVARAIALQADGKIVVVGTVNDDFGIVRLAP